MDHGEQFPQRLADPLAVGLLLLVGQHGEELRVADQMGQTEPPEHARLAHVLAIGVKAVAAQHAAFARRSDGLSVPRPVYPPYGKTPLILLAHCAPAS